MLGVKCLDHARCHRGIGRLDNTMFDWIKTMREKLEEMMVGVTKCWAVWGVFACPCWHKVAPNIFLADI